MAFEVTPMVFGTVAPTPCGFLTYYPLVKDFWYPTVVEPVWPGQEPVTVHSRFDGYFTPEGKVWMDERMSQSEKLFSDAELAAEYFNAEAHRRCIESHLEGVKDLPAYERAWEIQDRLYDFATRDHYWVEEEERWERNRIRIQENYKNYKEEKGYS